MENAVIVGAARTPIGDFMGMLQDIPAVELGVVSARAAMERAGVNPGQVDDVVAGMVYKVGVKGNPARQVQLKAGIPEEVAAATIEQQCASSMRAMEIATQQIMHGKSSVCLVVGMESMSQVPHLLMGARAAVSMSIRQTENLVNN